MPDFSDTVHGVVTGKNYQINFVLVFTNEITDSKIVLKLME